MGIIKKLGDKTKGAASVLGDKTKDAASAIGSKSSEVVEKGKLKLDQTRLEGSIKDKKVEIGEYVYQSYSRGEDPDRGTILTMIDDIKKMEVQIAEIKGKMQEK